MDFFQFNKQNMRMDIDTPVRNQYRTKFTSIWEAVMQQDTSILESYVTIMQNCSGEKIEVPYLGPTELNERTQRFQKIEFTEPLTGKRQMKPFQFEKFIGLSTDDKMFMDTLELTSHQLIEQQRKAAARVRDMVILGVKRGAGNTYVIRDGSNGEKTGGILAPNYTGDGGTTLTPFDPSMVVPADFKMSGTKESAGMLIEKIIEGKRMLESNESHHEGSGDTICVAITPRQKAQMLMWDQSQNGQYGFQALTHGKINQMLGVNFLVTNMLPVDADGNRICPMWLKSRVILGVWENPQFRIDKLESYHDAVQVGVSCAFGACRKGEKEFVKILCSEK